MSKFSDIWNGTYESLPLNSEQESQGADRIRNFKLNIRQRLAQDHSWNGDDNDGYHNWVTLLGQGAPPVPTPANGGPAGSLFTMGVNGVLEVFYRNSAGVVVQITANGAINLAVASPGDVKASASSVATAGWVFCYGQSLDKTQAANAALFAAIGYTYGGGGNNFSVPDLRGRTVFGLDPSNATGRLTNPSAHGNGINSGALGNSGGEQAHRMSVDEMTPHVHGGVVVSLTTDAFQGGTTPAFDQFILGGTDTGVGLANDPFNVVPPGIILNWLIKL